MVIIIIKWIVWNKCQRHKSNDNLSNSPTVLYVDQKDPHNSESPQEKVRRKDGRRNLLFDTMSSIIPFLKVPSNVSKKNTSLIHPETQC